MIKVFSLYNTFLYISILIFKKSDPTVCKMHSVYLTTDDQHLRAPMELYVYGHGRYEYAVALKEVDMLCISHK